MRTQVAIIGGGPSGLLLGKLLADAGVECVILERHTRDHVLARIRAGVLEWGTVKTLRRAGVGQRMDVEGQIHHGCAIGFDNQAVRLDFKASVGKQVMVYGQTEVTKDLYAAHEAIGTDIRHGVECVELSGLDTRSAKVGFRHLGQDRVLDCDFVAGCDGFHGVSRQTIPEDARTVFEKVYPFGWLGILSETPPVDDELIYAGHQRGFALASMRNPQLSRYYIQVPTGDQVDAWSDTAFWDELRRRLPIDAAERLVTGPSIEKSIAPLRSFVSEPMRWGRLFLCGDAAHIVPPTGAKGLNLAVSDVHYLSAALTTHYSDRDSSALEAYSDRALGRVWKAVRFSWWMTKLLHRFPHHGPFQMRMQRAEYDHLAASPTAQASLAENYVGLPF